MGNTKVFHHETIELEDVDAQGASLVKVRWLISKEIGANNFAMRIFEVESTGFTPLHKHPWEHEVFVLEGEGQLLDGTVVNPLKSGDVAFIPPNEMHQFKNAGKKVLKFICLIPYSEN